MGTENKKTAGYSPAAPFASKGAIAQLGEHRVCNAGVVGSSPSSSILSEFLFVVPIADFFSSIILNRPLTLPWAGESFSLGRG